MGFFALSIAGLTSPDIKLVSAAYPAMRYLAWCVILPFAITSLVVGVFQSLVTPWGLFRHYWVVAKLVLSVLVVLVLIMQMGTITLLAEAAGERVLAGEFRGMQLRLVVHAGGGLVVLIIATVLAVYKPWGLTDLGKRKQAR